MKVLYVTRQVAPYTTGGMQTVSRTHIEGLSALGADMVVVHSERALESEPGALPCKCRYVELPRQRLVSKLALHHYTRQLCDFSLGVHRVVQLEQPDVIYAEGAVVYHTLRLCSQTPILFHPHALDMFQRASSVLNWTRGLPLRSLFRFHCRRADAVVSQGGMLTDLLLTRLGVNRDRVVFLPNSVKQVSSREVARARDDRLRLLFVGRPDPKKGLSLLTRLMKELPEATLDVVGVADQRGQIPRTTFHGVVRERVRLDGFYRTCHVLVLPSYSEGMATVLLEAMSTGMPAIATDVGATRELVIPRQTGWLIAPGDPSGLADAIRDAIRCPESTYASMSRACVQHVRQGYLSSIVCRRLYEQLVWMHDQRTMHRHRDADRASASSGEST